VGASVYGSIEDSDLLLAYTNLSNRVHYGASVYQFRNDFLLFTASDEDEFVSQIYRGAEIALSRPFSKFSRIELALEGVTVSEEVYRQSFVAGDVETVDGGGTFVFARPSIAYVVDNALWGGTGPVSGRRARLSVERAIGEIGFTTVVADARQYLNVRQRYSFAVRLIGAASLGADPQRFRVGGPLTVRGLDYGELDGTRLGLANVEFRFPFIDELALGWPLPLRLRGVRGVVFVDAASAWEETRKWRAVAAGGGELRLDDIVASYGAGARLNLGYFVVRYDMAQRTNLSRNVGELRHQFAIGTDF
jgi:outer membrane protein assembly factor BamA